MMNAKKIVYAATLQDSNDNYCPEVITDIDVLAKYANNKIEIIKELHRDKAVEVLKKHNLTISTAESFTGGMIASMICDVSGASNYFKGTIVSYTK